MSTPTYANTPLGLGDIQGNILKGHGREFTALLLFRFGTDAERNRDFLRKAADPFWCHRITSAQEQNSVTELIHALAPNKSQQPEAYARARCQPFRSLGLTASGLRACGHTISSLGLEGDEIGSDVFWKPVSPADLSDPEPWEDGYCQDPHGVWLLAHAGEEACGGMVALCHEMLESFGAAVIGIERGFRWTPNPDGFAYEPFGFADGFARTQIVADPDSPLRTLIGPGIDGTVRKVVHPYEIPLEQVMLPRSGVLAGSSFLVLRKLEQNVRAFLTAESELGKRLGHHPAGQTVVDPGALFIGRERNGTPVIKDATEAETRFDFRADPKARRCPFHAHIRKMNPRQSRFSEPHGMSDRRNQLAAQFVRRGVVYGPRDQLRPRWADPAEAPAGGVGLLFLAYMSSIRGQFLQMHESWATDAGFPNADGGVDPLFNPSAGTLPWAWPQQPRLEPILLSRFVTAKGTCFLLVPSLRWMRDQSATA